MPIIIISARDDCNNVLNQQLRLSCSIYIIAGAININILSSNQMHYAYAAVVLPCDVRGEK